MAAITERLDPLPYRPGPQGNLMVQLAVIARGHPEPSEVRVGSAWISLGARPVTVGEVAEHLIARGHPLAFTGGQLRLGL